MSVLWINLSTRWGLSSVQAALNVVISVLSTIGIWAHSRYWWQQESSKILRGKSDIPLLALWNPSGPGEGIDLMSLPPKDTFSKKNWRTLCQLVLVTAVTFTSMFSGPIAQVSLRNTLTVQSSELQVALSTKGAGAHGNILQADVLWNETIQSFDEAAFPYTQLLDYLPPSTASWTYVPSEWDPTWKLACDETPETYLQNVSATGNSTFYDPINAFPAYRNTFDRSWFDKTKYRVQADFTSWANYSDPLPIKDVLFFVLIQSDPTIDNQMQRNEGTLQISISVLHARSFDIISVDKTEAGATTWKPVGPVGSASFTRLECNITRKTEVHDPNAIPWVWTNDTYSITQSYEMYWTNSLEESGARGMTITTPTAKDLLRFYQAYMATMTTLHSSGEIQRVSVWMDTVQLSTIFLVVAAAATGLTLWLTGCYLWFWIRNRSKLEDVFVPSSKLEWMIHAAKAAKDEKASAQKNDNVRDKDCLFSANFGIKRSPFNGAEHHDRHPSFARVSINSIIEASQTQNGGAFSKGAPQIRIPSPSHLSVRDSGQLSRESRSVLRDVKDSTAVVTIVSDNDAMDSSQEGSFDSREEMQESNSQIRTPAEAPHLSKLLSAPSVVVREEDAISFASEELQTAEPHDLPCSTSETTTTIKRL